MSLSKALKTLSKLTAVAVFSFSVLLAPIAGAANNGGVSAPSAQAPEGKCAHASSPADKSKCLKQLIKDQKALCADLRQKKQTAKAKSCAETANSQIARLKATTERLQAQKQEAKKFKTPADYQQCLKRYAYVDDTSDMRAKINKLVVQRKAVVGKLQKKVNTFKNEEAKQTMTDNLSADIATLDQYQTESTKTDSPSALQVIYCEAIFKLQISRFRVNQVNYLKNIETQLTYDTALKKQYENPWNLSENPKLASNLLKTEVTGRLDIARQLTNDNITAENTALAQVLSAKMTSTGEGTTLDYTSDLTQPEIIKSGKRDRAIARQNYNEAQVIRKAANTFSQDRTLKLVSVTLLDKANQTISSDASSSKDKEAAQPRKAKVIINTGSKDYTRTLARADKASPWTVQR